MVLREIQSRHQPRLEPSNQEGNQGNLSWEEGSSCHPPAISPFPAQLLGVTDVIWASRTLKTPQAAQRSALRAARDLEEGPSDLAESPCHALAMSFPSRDPGVAPSFAWTLPLELPTLPSSVHILRCSSKCPQPGHTCRHPSLGPKWTAYHRQ